MKDQARVRGWVAVLRGEDGKERVQHVLQELHQLLAASPHDPAQDLGDPATPTIQISRHFWYRVSFGRQILRFSPFPLYAQVSRHFCFVFFWAGKYWDFPHFHTLFKFPAIFVLCFFWPPNIEISRHFHTMLKFTPFLYCVSLGRQILRFPDISTLYSSFRHFSNGSISQTNFHVNWASFG